MNGILLINKPANMTSHDVVFQLRKKLKTKRIGHSGTLDPNATGVLVVLVGKATKILPYLEDTDKEYIASMELGKRTLSDDIWGEVLEVKPVCKVEDFTSTVLSFVGKQKQVPPRISSIKIHGKKLYEYTRQGIMIDLPERDIEIYKIDDIDETTLSFRVACSSGTYIRSLCVAIATKTNNLGCMKSLVRSKVGRFDLSQCYDLDAVDEHVELIAIEQMLAHIPQIVYEPIQDVYYGKRIYVDSDASQICIVHENRCIAIYERDGKTYKSVRGLW